MFICQFPVTSVVPKIRVKTPTRQRPRGSESRRCGACGHGIRAGDKFCMGCGMPTTGAASAAAPQKQRPKTKTKARPAAPRVKRAKPAIPRTRKRNPKIVPVAVPREKSETAPAREQSSKGVPGTVYCAGCAQPFPHGRYIKCPNCGRFWIDCAHRKKKSEWKDRWGCYRATPGHHPAECANVDASHPDYAAYHDFIKTNNGKVNDELAWATTDVREAREWAAIHAEWRVKDGLPPQRRA